MTSDKTYLPLSLIIDLFSCICFSLVLPRLIMSFSSIYSSINMELLLVGYWIFLVDYVVLDLVIGGFFVDSIIGSQ